MTLHHAARDGFSTQAEAYVRGRPEYPTAIQDWLRAELSLRTGCTVVDLGAGTGKFTSQLTASGARVLAVEPITAMADQLRKEQPGVQILEGTADRIPLADSSCDAVVCAQSFHWFATETALAEIRRVLRPGGSLGLVWNVRDESVRWVAALTAIMQPFEGDTPLYQTFAWRSVFPAAGFSELREQQFQHSQAGPPEQVLVDRVLSVSFIAALSPERQASVATEIRALIEATPELAGRSTVTFPYTTVAVSCSKLPA